MITIDWGTLEINVPQSYLTFVSGVDYTLDTDQFRLDLKALEASVDGMPFPDAHEHTATKVLGGTAYAQFEEIINGYTVNFEDTGTPYRVTMLGSNNNVQDVTNLVANVSTASQNSAGLVNNTPDLAQEVWNYLLSNPTIPDSTKDALEKILKSSKLIPAAL